MPVNRSAASAALAVAATLLAGAAAAAPAVVADIPPVHSLVARVMEGAGAPTLLLPPGASPHDYAMRPSEAARLDEAALVFWIGEALTPWLDPAIDALGAGAAVVELAEAPGVRSLGFREGAVFAAHQHADEHEGGHGRGDHAAGEEGGDEPHSAHDDHDHDHGHDHEGMDPHVWLDPENARAMLPAIAAALSGADPANAARYEANAAAARQELAALIEEIDAALAPARGRPFVVFHDAYHHFEARFAIEAAGSISVSDAAPPGPKRLEAIRELIRGQGIVCVFAEPQFDPKLAALVAEGTGARTETLDPLGASLEPGSGLYPALIRGLAAALSGCLASGG